MTTIKKATNINISRQEGDTSDIMIVVPDIIDMTLASVKFQVKDPENVVIIDKSTAEGSIQLNGQEIYVPLLSADTKGRAGKFRYEFEVTTLTAIITIISGDFEIEKN